MEIERRTFRNALIAFAILEALVMAAVAAWKYFR